MFRMKHKRNITHQRLSQGIPSVLQEKLQRGQVAMLCADMHRCLAILGGLVGMRSGLEEHQSAPIAVLYSGRDVQRCLP